MAIEIMVMEKWAIKILLLFSEAEMNWNWLQCFSETAINSGLMVMPAENEGNGWRGDKGK